MKIKFHSISIPELVDRPIIRDDQVHEYLNKMTDEEIKTWEREVEYFLEEERVPKKFPDWNAAFMAKAIDRAILYQMFK